MTGSLSKLGKILRGSLPSSVKSRLSKNCYATIQRCHFYTATKYQRHLYKGSNKNLAKLAQTSSLPITSIGSIQKKCFSTKKYEPYKYNGPSGWLRNYI